MAHVQAAETLTILDDTEARRAARVYRKRDDVRESPVPERHWPLPTVDDFVQTAAYARRQARGKRNAGEPPVYYWSAVKSFRTITGLLVDAAAGIETEELLEEVARSWRIASDPDLGSDPAAPRGVGDPSLWALRSTSDWKTSSLRIAFPLCTVRREIAGSSKSTAPGIEVVIAPYKPRYRPRQEGDPAFTIMLFLFDPKPAPSVTTTLKRRNTIESEATKAKRQTPPRTVPEEAEVEQIVHSERALSAADEETLKRYLSNDNLRKNLSDANDCLQHPTSPELRASYVGVILRAIDAAARLDDIELTRAERAVMRTILAGDPLPSISELTSDAYGMGTADAAALASTWESAPAVRGYSWHALARLMNLNMNPMRFLGITRALVLLGIYTTIGGKGARQSWLQYCLRDIAEREGGARVVSWLRRHRDAVRRAATTGGGLAPSEGMLLTAYTMANDYRPHDAAAYLEALRDCGVTDDLVEMGLALCQALEGGDATLPAPSKRADRGLGMSLGFGGIAKQLVKHVPAPGAVRILSRIARSESMSRVFLATAQTVPGMVGANAADSSDEDSPRGFAAEALAELEAFCTESVAGGTPTEVGEPACEDAAADLANGAGNPATVDAPTVLPAAALLAYIAGAAPTWLQASVTRAAEDRPTSSAAGATAASPYPGPDAPAFDVLEGFYTVWRERHPEEPRAAYALRALEAGRARFAAAELAGVVDPEARPCRDALAGLEDIESAAARVTAHSTAPDEELLRAALIRTLTAIKSARAGTHQPETPLAGAADARTADAPNAETPALDPELNRAIGMRVIALMAQCFQRQPGCLAPTPSIDPAPFDLLVSYAAERAAETGLAAERGTDILCTLVAAGARSSTFRAESALVGHYARRVLVLNGQVREAINRALALSGYHDVANVLAPCILNAGTMAAFRARCRMFCGFVRAIPENKRKLNAPAAPAPAGAMGTATLSRTEERMRELQRTRALYRMPLVDLVALFMEDPDLHVGRTNPGKDLKRALNAHQYRRAASALMFSYVDAWQLDSLTDSLRWVYLEDVNRDPIALARELPACASLMREYVLGPLMLAAEQSLRPHDEAQQGLAHLGSALVDVIQTICEQGILARGYHQEQPVANLARALAQAAARLAMDPRLDAAPIAAAATALSDAVARTFPECANLDGSVTDLSDAALVEVLCQIVEDGASTANAEHRELVLAELQRRADAAQANARVRTLAAWCDELAQSDGAARGNGAALSAMTRCALELVRAGVRGGGQQALRPAADALETARGTSAQANVALVRLICRYHRTFGTDATWCTVTAQQLIDRTAQGVPAELLNDVARMARAAAEEASSVSRGTILLETAEVARALAARGAATPESYGAAAREALERADADAPELAHAVTVGALYRHMGPLVTHVATCGDQAAARRVARVVRPLFSKRPWYLSRTVLKSALSACEQDEEGLPGIEELRAFAEELDAPELVELIDALAQIAGAGEASALGALSPLIMLVQGGGPNLANVLVSTLAAAERADRARADSAGTTPANTDTLGSTAESDEADSPSGVPAAGATPAISFEKLARRVARQTLPPVYLIDAFQQLALQHRGDTLQKAMGGILAGPAEAYIVLVDGLTAAHLAPSEAFAATAAELTPAGIATLPRAFRPAARTLARTAANPAPLRARYALNGRFEGFASAQRDADAERALAEIVRAQAAELAVAASARNAVDQEPQQGTAGTEDAAPDAGMHEKASEALGLISAMFDDTSDAAEEADPLQQLYLVVAASLLALGSGSTDGQLICGMGPHLLARAAALLRSCLAETPFADLEAACAQTPDPRLEALADLLDLARTLTDDTAEDSARAALRRLRAPLARALGRALNALADRALATANDALAQAMPPESDQGNKPAPDTTAGLATDPATAALASACGDLAAAAALLAEAGLAPTVRERTAAETLRYLGGTGAADAGHTGPHAAPGTTLRLSALCNAAHEVRHGNAHAGTETIIALLRALPAPEAELARLANHLDNIRAHSASRIAVQIENVELDGRIALIVHNDSSRVPAELTVTAIDLIPPVGEPAHKNLVGADAAEAHVALPCRGAGPAETPLGIDMDIPARIESATVAVHLRSGAGNHWCVRSEQPLPAARITRALGQESYRVEAHLDGSRGRFVTRGDAGLDDVTDKLRSIDSRKRGVKIVGAKGVGKTALAREVAARPLTVDGTLENVFVPVTLDLDANPALLLYNLLQGLASSLAALADGTGEVPAVNNVPATSSTAGTARSTRPERAAEAAAAIRDTIAEVREEQGTAQRPKLSELGAFVCSDISTALAGLRRLGFAVTFIVDEAQELACCDNEDLDRLRSIVADTGGVCAWLFVGTGDLVDIDHRTVDRETAFARLMEAATVAVAHFPPDRRAEIIAHMLDDPNVLGAADAGMRFTPDAIAYLAEYTGGHARSTLKIANAVLTAARRGPGSDSPFARETKRYIYAADIQWVLRGGGVRADDSIAYDSVRSDFREIEQRSGVEMALRALLKLEGDGEREPSLAQLVAAAQELDDEKAADADGLSATLGRGMGTLVSRGFVDRQAAKTPEGGTEERYTFASVMYERFARFGYRDVVAARLVDMAARGHVSDETRAREAELREEGLQKLYEEALAKAELASAELQKERAKAEQASAALQEASAKLQEAREFGIRQETRAEMELQARKRAEARAEEERRRADRPQTVVVNPQLEHSSLNLAQGDVATAGGEHVHGNVSTVTIGQLTVNYTAQTLQHINATVAAALEGDTAPEDASELTAQLPWPSDHRFMQAADSRIAKTLAAAQERAERSGQPGLAFSPQPGGQTVAGGSADAARLAGYATPGASTPEPNSPAPELDIATADEGLDTPDLRRQALADDAYAAHFADAAKLMLGSDAAGLAAWLEDAGNRKILSAVGITWNGEGQNGNNPLFARAFRTHDDDLVATCRSVCVAAMINCLLDTAQFENHSPVAALLAQEAEHLWKARLMGALAGNPVAGGLLVNWDEGGDFTGGSGIPLSLWAQRATDGGREVIDRSELGRFCRLGSFGPKQGGQSPWDREFPAPLAFGTPYRLAPAYAELRESTLKEIAPEASHEVWSSYDGAFYEESERLNGTIRRVNNLDVLARALVAANADSTAADGAAVRYRELARYFAGLTCVRSLRNHASHGGPGAGRTVFDARCARMLFSVTASDASNEQELHVPRIVFCSAWRSAGSEIPWSTVQPMDEAGGFEVHPANAGVLHETARLADELGYRSIELDR